MYLYIPLGSATTTYPLSFYNIHMDDVINNTGVGYEKPFINVPPYIIRSIPMPSHWLPFL